MVVSIVPPEELARLIDIAEEAIFVCDPDGRIVFWNAGAATMYGFEADDALGRYPRELLRTRFPRPPAEIAAEMQESGWWRGELVHQARDGREVIVRSVRALYGAEPPQSGFVMQIDVDMTEQRRVEQALQRSEERFRTLFERSVDAVLLMTLDGRILMANPAACEMFGRTDDELRDVGAGAIVDASDPRVALARESGEGRERGHAEFRMLRSDGSAFTAEVTWAVFGDLHTEPVASMIVRDVTERERAEEALRDSRELFADLFANASDLIQAVRPDGTLEYANEAWCRTLEYEPFDVRHLRFLDVVAPAERERCREVLDRVLGGWSGPLETVFVSRTGRKIPVEGTLTRRVRHGQPVAIRGFFRDATQRKRIERERERLLRTEKRARQTLAKQNERLRELDQLKDELVSTVSHELRTPLTSIRGFLQLLLDEDAGPLTPSQRRYAETAAESSELLLRTVRDLLELARLDSEGIRIAHEPVDLNALARQVVGELGAEAGDAGMEVRLESGDLPEVPGDADALQRVLENLIGNAVKFGDAGSAVSVRTAVDDGHVRLEVENVGAPIPRREQELVFGRFVRGSNAVARHIGGSGLGLAIVKAVVDAHGGTISVHSARRSTTFTVTLPASR